MNNNGYCKILISSLDAYGHVNACLGLGAILANRGNQVYFLNRKIYKEAAEKQGMKFLALEDYDKDVSKKGEGNILLQVMDKMEEKLSLSVLERVKTWNADEKELWRFMFDEVRRTEKVIKKVVNEMGFDVVLGDFYCTSPFFWKNDKQVPCVPIISYNPVVLYDGPPSSSGLSVNDEPEKWQEFREAEARMQRDFESIYGPWFLEAGMEVPCLDENRTFAKYFGIYIYPEALDYKELNGPKPKWVRLESSIRKSGDGEFEIPECLKDKPGKLIYFSLGSLGSGYLNLMRRLLEIFSKSPHRFIVSKGGFGDQLTLSGNMWGQNHVDQLAILPNVDMVIGHGGNNTLVETLVAGKPMIVMPLFGDQPDNAQRIEDLNLGKRIDPYGYEDEQLLQAIEDVLSDTKLKENIAAISKRLQTSDSSDKVAGYIEELGRTRISPI